VPVQVAAVQPIPVVAPVAEIPAPVVPVEVAPVQVPVAAPVPVQVAAVQPIPVVAPVAEIPAPVVPVEVAPVQIPVAPPVPVQVAAVQPIPVVEPVAEVQAPVVPVEVAPVQIPVAPPVSVQVAAVQPIPVAAPVAEIPAPVAAPVVHAEPVQVVAEPPVPAATPALQIPTPTDAAPVQIPTGQSEPVQVVPKQLAPVIAPVVEIPVPIAVVEAPPAQIPPATVPVVSTPAVCVDEIEVHVQIPCATPTPVVPPAQPEVVAETVPVPVIAETATTEPVEAEEQNGFALLSLNEYVMKAVVAGGYTQPTPIQSEIIPHVLAGQDVLAQSQTGSGKTAAFALPILSLIDTGKNASRNPQVLVLAPTRELAIQVSKSFSTYGAYLPGFTVTTIYGGQSYDSQFRQLKRGVNVVVGTPGRVIDHIKRGTLNLSELGCLVLDEADEMLNMGFLDDVKFVLEHTPEERQVALFSATLPAPIRTIAEKYLDNPARVTIKQKTATADSIRQRALFVTPRNKIDALKRVLEAEETDGVIIFTKTRDATVTVADQLKREGLSTVALNGDMPQRVRERTIEQLKAGELDILVATDVAARGLDVTRVSHVINYDAPNDNESYIHRVGRTGRMGRKGEAIIFLSNSQRGRLRQIERATKQTIEVIDLPTADDINATRVKRFMQRITEAARNEDVAVFEEMIQGFAEESETPMLKIAAALAHLGQQGRPFFVKELPPGRKDRRDFDQDRDRGNSRFDRNDRNSRSDRGDRRPRQGDGSPAPVEAGMDRYRIAVGWQDGVKPGNIVGAVANEGGVDGEAIGAIRIYSSYSTIDLPEGMPAHVRQTLQTTRVAGRPLELRPYTDEPQEFQKRDGGGDRSGGRNSFGANRSGPGAAKRPFNKKPRRGGKPGNRP
jgi:ATP-dependent RNA helicase DeaD